MSRKNLPKIEVHAVAWTDGKPLKHQCFLSYNGLRLISDPMPTTMEALENLRLLLEKQQEFVKTALNNWETIASAKLPVKIDNGRGMDLIDFD